MEFFYKLFPYESLIKLDNNTLTIWWVILTIAVFLYGVVHLKKIIDKIEKGVNKSLKILPNIDDINDQELKELMEDYRSSFINHNGIIKTDEEAIDYFNEKNLLSKNTNLKLVSSLSGLLVGIGILGTFIGLTFGISNFKATSTDEIKESIELLLSGMGTAFVSSIYGMLFSIIFTIIERIQTNKLQSIMHEYCYKLDKCFKITKDDERAIEIQQKEKSLTEIFYYKDENNRLISPTNIFRDIYDEAQKQSLAVQTFSTDLALKIDAGFEALLTNNQMGIIPELQSLKNEINILGQKLQDPTNEMTKNIAKDLENALNKMMEDFKYSISGSTKGELEKIAELLGNAGETLTSFPDRIELMTKSMNENFEHMRGVVVEIAGKTIAQAEESTLLMRTQVEEMNGAIIERMSELQMNHEILVNKQGASLEQSQKIIEDFSLNLGLMKELSNNINETMAGFSSVKTELGKVSYQLVNISQVVKDATETFSETQEDFVTKAKYLSDNSREIIGEIQNAMIRAKNVSSEYADKFMIIQEGLQNIFAQIQEGLKEYSESISTSLEVYLEKYTSSVNATTQSIANVTAEQSNFIDELSEQFEELVKQLKELRENS